MIKLDSTSATSYVTTRNGVAHTDTVDTLIVRYVEMNLVGGTILAIIDRGTMVTTPEVPATDTTPAVPAHTDFVAIDAPLWVDVRADGTFTSRDGAWKGTVASAGTIVAGLKAAFDGFLLAGGVVSGTAV